MPHFELQDSLTSCPSLPPWLRLLLSLNHLCLTVNSSVNFLIYIAFGREFKQAVATLHTEKFPATKRNQHSLSPRSASY